MLSYIKSTTFQNEKELSTEHLLQYLFFDQNIFRTNYLCLLNKLITAKAAAAEEKIICTFVGHFHLVIYPDRKTLKGAPFRLYKQPISLSKTQLMIF